MFDAKKISGQVGTAGSSNPSAHYDDPSSPPPMDRVTGEIVNEGRQLDKALEYLHEEITNLETVLSIVLRPVAPETNGNSGATPTPPRSTMAEGIAEANRRLFSAASRLSAIRNRVDL